MREVRGDGETLHRHAPDHLLTSGDRSPAAAHIDFLAGRTASWVGDDAPVTVRARALAEDGAAEPARALICGLDVSSLPLVELLPATWVASRCGPTDVAVAMLDRLRGEGQAFLEPEGVPFGERLMFVGMLEAATGDLEAGIATLVHAVRDGDRRSPLWGALARVELIRALRSAICIGGADHPALHHRPTPIDDPDRLDDRTALEAATTAAVRTFFAAGGYRHQASRLAAMDEPCDVAMARPRQGHLVAGSRWTVGFGVQPPVTVKASKGLRALAHLVRTPDRPVPAIELDVVAAGGDPGPIRRTLADALARAADTGDDGLARETGSALNDEATRSRVGKLLHRTIDRVSEHHRLLGRHLAHTVHAGHLCHYRPPVDVHWRL